MTPRASPLRGRDAEIRTLLAALDRPSDGWPGGGVLLEGGPGVGKTRLAREIASLWSSRGGSCLWTAATLSNQRFDFGTLGGLAPELDPGSFDSAAARLRRVLADRPDVLVVVDNAHLLDPASGSLLHSLALADRAPVLLVVVRSGSEWPDAVTALVHDEVVTLHHLDPLGVGDLGALAGDLLGGMAAPSFIETIAELSQGDLSIATELIRLSHKAEAIQRRVGQWTVVGVLPFGRRARESVEGRITALSAGAQQAADVLAVSQVITLSTFVEVAGRQAAEELDQRGLLATRTSGSSSLAELSHPLDRVVLLATMGSVRRLGAVQSLERALVDKTDLAPEDRLVLADCLLESGTVIDRSPALLTEASKRVRPDYPRAERFARAALSAGGGFEAADYLIDALLWQGRVEEARQLAGGLDDLTEEQRSYLELRMSRMVQWITGERSDADESGPPANPDRQVAVADAARRAAMAAAAGQPTEALRGALAVLESPGVDDEAVCWATGAALIVIGGRGEAERALALLDRAYDCSRRLTDFNYRLLLSVLEVRTRRLSGDLAAARHVVHELAKAAADAQVNLGLVELAAAEVALAEGLIGDAEPRLREAASGLDAVDFGGLSATAHFHLARVLAMKGDAARSDAEFQLGTACESRTLAVFLPEQLLSKAMALWCNDHTKAARGILTEARRAAASSDQPLVGVHVLLAELVVGHGTPSAVLELSAAVNGPFSNAASMQAQGVATADHRLVGSAAREFHAFGAHLDAAEGFAQAAAMARLSGQDVEGRSLAGQAHALVEQMGGIETPSLRPVLPGRPLTRRQRDVALLAAQGLPNRVIAERLHVGVRTVESHLASAFQRLGLSDRTELAAWFTANTTVELGS